MHTTHTHFNQPVQHRMLFVYINRRHRDPQLISLPEDTVSNKWKESSLVGTHLSQHCATASAKTTQDFPDLIMEKTEQVNNEYGGQTRCLLLNTEALLKPLYYQCYQAFGCLPASSGTTQLLQFVLNLSCRYTLSSFLYAGTICLIAWLIQRQEEQMNYWYLSNCIYIKYESSFMNCEIVV